MALYNSTTGDIEAFDSFHRHQVIIANLKLPIFFRFTQNPNEFSFRLEKEYNETQTVGGYVFEMWGKKPQRLHATVTIKKDNSWKRVLGINDNLTNFELEDHTYNPELMILQTLFNIDQRRMANLRSSAATTVSDVVSTAKSAASGVFSAVKWGVDKVKNAYNTVIEWDRQRSGCCNCLCEEAETGTVNKNPEPTIIDEATKPTPQNKPSALVPDLKPYVTPDQTSLDSYMNSMTDTVIYYKGNIYTGFFTSFDYKEDGKTPFANVVHFDFLVTGTFTDYIDTQLTQTALGRTLAGLWGGTTSLFTGGSLVSSLIKNTKSVFGL